MLNFKPKDKVFFELFSQGIEIAAKSAKEFRKMVDELDNPNDRLVSLSNLEHEGDKVTHKLIEYTKKMFITPLDREDIFNLTKEIDNITDDIESAAQRFFMYNIDMVTPEAIQIIDKLVEATEELVKVVDGLNNLGNSDEMVKGIIDVNTIENESDCIYRNAMRKLFDNPEDILYVIKWKDIYKYLEDSVDACEKLANEIRGVVTKYA